MTVGSPVFTAAPDESNEPARGASAPHDETGMSRMDRIARRAYEISQARGGDHGGAVEDWLQAEREIDGQ
jgi:hypothetical protein